MKVSKRGAPAPLALYNFQPPLESHDGPNFVLSRYLVMLRYLDWHDTGVAIDTVNKDGIKGRTDRDLEA